MLEDAHELAPKGAKYAIAHNRGGKENLHTQLEGVIRKTGFKPWGKPRRNMRSSRETDLAETHPVHVVCVWIGNTEPVAA